MGDNNQDQQSKHADTVIKNHVIWSLGASFIPLPIADVIAVSALQMDMIRQLCRVYNKDFSETQGKAIITSLSSAALARAGARGLIKLIPGVGTLVGGVTASVFNGASTYALGEVFKQHFSEGGTILDLDTERLKKFYKEKFEKGKKIAEELSDEEIITKKPATGKKKKVTKKILEDTPTPDTIPDAPKTKEDVVQKLKELSQLKEDGILTEEEFQEMKKKIILAYVGDG